MTRDGGGAGAFPRQQERSVPVLPPLSPGDPGLIRGSVGLVSAGPGCAMPPSPAADSRPQSPLCPTPSGGQLPPWGKPLWGRRPTARGRGEAVLLCNFIHTGVPCSPHPAFRCGGRRGWAAGGWVFQEGPGPSEGSLAGVVDLDLLVDGGQHLPHSGLQPAQLGCFGIQHALVPLVLLLQCCSDRGNVSQPGPPPLTPPTAPASPLRPHLAAAAACPGRPAAVPRPPPATAVPGCSPAAHPAPGAPPAPLLSGTGPEVGPPAPAGQWGWSAGSSGDPCCHTGAL